LFCYDLASMIAAVGPARVGLVVLGEFFIDLVFYNLPKAPKMGEEVKTDCFAEFPGGGVATTALIAASLGCPTTVVTRVGQDVRETPIWRKLQQSGVSLNACEYSVELPTAKTVSAAFDSERMMITHDSINKGLHTLLMRPGVLRQLRKARHLHLACSLRPLPTWTRAIRRCRAQGLTVSTDIGWNPDVLQSIHLPKILRECDFTFPNELEAQAMTNEKSVEKAALKLARWVRVPIVKLGSSGCVAVCNGKILRVKSVPVRTVDATGAGDAFNGGFLHGYLAGWPLEDCLRAGNICGALAATNPGGSSTIVSRRKLLQLMRQI
jgi:sugar/nucleoside kinase (ribokinase family)